jgi:hypothetical protein
MSSYASMYFFCPRHACAWKYFIRSFLHSNGPRRKKVFNYHNEIASKFDILLYILSLHRFFTTLYVVIIWRQWLPPLIFWILFWGHFCWVKSYTNTCTVSCNIHAFDRIKGNALPRSMLIYFTITFKVLSLRLSKKSWLYEIGPYTT